VSKRVVLAVVAGVLAAAMMPGVAWAGKTVPVLTLTPDLSDCDMVGNDEIGLTIEVTGFHGPRAYVQVIASTRSWAESGVFTLHQGEITGWYFDYAYVSEPTYQIHVQARLVRTNGNPISDWLYDGTIGCAYSYT
jgi:hypothetical protein